MSTQRKGWTCRGPRLEVRARCTCYPSLPHSSPLPWAMIEALSPTSLCPTNTMLCLLGFACAIPASPDGLHSVLLLAEIHGSITAWLTWHFLQEALPDALGPLGQAESSCSGHSPFKELRSSP